MKASTDVLITADQAAETLKDKSHIWETMTIDGTTRTYCKRCMRAQDEQRLPDGKFLPCRGLIA